MKKTSAIFIVFAFLAIAVFGIFVVHADNGSSHVRCLAETAAGADCPQNNIFATANFLLNVFKSFFTANLISIILFALCVAVILLNVFMRAKNSSAKSYALLHKENSAAYPLSIKLQLARIRTLYEKRNPSNSR